MAPKLPDNEFFNQQGFFQNFREFVEGIDKRLREAEKKGVSIETSLENAKADRCDPRARDLKELFDSRNDLVTRVGVIESRLSRASADHSLSYTMKVAVVSALLGGVISGIFALVAVAYF